MTSENTRKRKITMRRKADDSNASDDGLLKAVGNLLDKRLAPLESECEVLKAHCSSLEEKLGRIAEAALLAQSSSDSTKATLQELCSSIHLILRPDPNTDHQAAPGIIGFDLGQRGANALQMVFALRNAEVVDNDDGEVAPWGDDDDIIENISDD